MYGGIKIILAVYVCMYVCIQCSDDIWDPRHQQRVTICMLLIPCICPSVHSARMIMIHQNLKRRPTPYSMIIV